MSGRIVRAFFVTFPQLASRQDFLYNRAFLSIIKLKGFPLKKSFLSAPFTGLYFRLQLHTGLSFHTGTVLTITMLGLSFHTSTRQRFLFSLLCDYPLLSLFFNYFEFPIQLLTFQFQLKRFYFWLSCGSLNSTFFFISFKYRTGDLAQFSLSFYYVAFFLSGV